MITILGVLALLIVVLLVAASTRPDVFRIERRATINAGADQIFPLIQDFRQWARWSPWEKLDPELKRTYSGASSGKGAIYEWVGVPKVGSGRMEVIDATPSTRVIIKLDFITPFEAHNTADFSLEPSESGTRVVWAMYGPQPFMNKVMSLFMNMDKLVGPDFEKGLAAMKAIAET